MSPGTGKMWKSVKRRKAARRSVTPGILKRKDTCQAKTKIAGLSRKSWCRSRSYKRKDYPVWCKFSSSVNGG